jgi:hypothetical protein
VVKLLKRNGAKNVAAAVMENLGARRLTLINETPYRFYPIDFHTTGLPLINYLPDRMAFALSRRYSKSVTLNDSWKGLLRRGICGATEHEILKIIRKGGSKLVLLSPTD